MYHTAFRLPHLQGNLSDKDNNSKPVDLPLHPNKINKIVPHHMFELPNFLSRGPAYTL